MKLIPKYQEPFGTIGDEKLYYYENLYPFNNRFRFNNNITLPYNWSSNILWNDWKARDESGSPLLNNNLSYPYSFGSNQQQQRFNYYGSSKNGIVYENLPWYQNYRKLLFTYDNNNKITGLSDLGKRHVQLWYDNSPDTIGYKKNIGDFLTNGKFSGFQVGNKYYNNIHDWLYDSTGDKLNGQNHNTPGGDVYYWTDENGNYQTGSSIPQGYKEYSTSNLGEYKNYVDEQNKLKELGGLGNLVNFRKLVRDNLSTYDNTHPFGEDLSKVDWNVSSNDPRLSTIQGSKSGTSNIKSSQQGSWWNKLAQTLGLKRGPKDENGSGQFGKSNNPISPALMEGLRIATDNAFNTINTENLIKNSDVSLINHTPNYRQVHGDYVSQLQGLKQAARLTNRLPLTSNALIEHASQLEAISKGNQYIDLGNLRDAQMYWDTSEKAWQQGKENNAAWDTVANTNSQKLAEFRNKIAELRFNTKKLNMQNWDTFATDMEKRAWQKYDLDEYKRLSAQEELNELYDQRNGVADRLLTQLQLYDDIQAESSKTTPDATKLAELKLKYRDISKQIIAQQYYNKLTRLGLYNEQLFRQMFPDFKVDTNQQNGNRTFSYIGLKKGGLLAKLLLSGGSLGVVSASSAGSGNPYLAGGSSGKSTSSSKASSSSKSSDDDTKTRDKLLNSIAETLKGIDGLNSDVNTLYKELTNFFDIQRYNPTSDDPMLFYSMYVKALNRVNQVKQSAKQFDNAYKNLEKTGSMTSPAIDANGYVYVGVADSKQITKIKPQEYLANPSKYHLLRNNELLELRKNHPEYSFSDNFITETAYNGTSIQEIHKFVKDILGKIGTDKQSQDMLVRQYGSNAVQGLQTLAQLAQGKLSSEETSAIIGGLTGALTEMNVTTQSQVKQAELALNTIKAMLPANMKSLLLLHAENEENVERMLVSFVAKGLDTSLEFKINDIKQLDENGLPKSGSKSGSGSGEGSDKNPKETTATKWVQGYGLKSTFQIITGGNKGWIVSGNTLPLTDSSDNSLGQASLSEASKAFGGALDLRHAFMGNSRISSLGLSQVLLEDGDITLVALPIDESQGYKRPAFGRLKALSEAESELKLNNINVADRQNLSETDKKKVNEIYQKHGLDPLFNNDGSINGLKFGYFGLVKGIAKETAFEEGSDFTRDYLIEATDLERKLFELLMKAKQKDFSISSGIMGIGKDNVYRGTIFIPVNTNIFNTQSGYGSTYAGTPSLDMAYETKQQFHDALVEQGGAHPERIIKTNFDIQ